jgi:hypothetical protein
VPSPIPILFVSPIESFSGSLLHILTDIWDLCHGMCCPLRRPFVHSVPDLHSRHCYFHVYSLDLIRLVEIKYLSCLKLHLCILDDIHHNTVGYDCDTHLQDCNHFVRLGGRAVRKRIDPKILDVPDDPYLTKAMMKQ